jgi:uncharacterized protein YfiM (DUF2279 family)
MSEKAPPDNWLGLDKLQHFLISAHLSLYTYQVSQESYNNTPPTARVEAVGLVISIGIGKELMDRQKPSDCFSYKDLVADALGIGLGLFIGHNLK